MKKGILWQEPFANLITEWGSVSCIFTRHLLRRPNMTAQEEQLGPGSVCLKWQCLLPQNPMGCRVESESARARHRMRVTTRNPGKRNPGETAFRPAPFSAARAMQFSSSARAADENFDYLFKIILIGDSNVGKTCVVQHFKSGVYTETQQNTIGVDFTVRSLEIDGKKVKMQVWDTAGQERFRTITQSYYRSAHAAIIAYDLTRRSTFESVPHWIHEIEKYGAANLVIMLIASSGHFTAAQMAERWLRIDLRCSSSSSHSQATVLLLIVPLLKALQPAQRPDRE
ncbi:ras-related protein Rab-19 isoform 2-T3 [Glossophaga mutica]